MNKRLRTGLIAMLVPFVNAQTPGLEGRWDGQIRLPDSPLEISVALQAGEPWTGTIDVPAQNITGAALEEVRVDGNTLTFAIADVPGNPTFRGTLSGGR